MGAEAGRLFFVLAFVFRSVCVFVIFVSNLSIRYASSVVRLLHALVLYNFFFCVIAANVVSLFLIFIII